jgi:autotransporter-associated beta strand protein
MLTLIAAEMAGLYGSAALASPAISTFYIAGETALDSGFSVGTQSISISNTSPTVFVPLGDYFEFGISMVVTGNPNSTAGDAWDLANQARGNPAQPSNLGLASAGMFVASTDSTAAMLAPVEGSEAGTINDQPYYNATDVLSDPSPSAFESPGGVQTGNGNVGYNPPSLPGIFDATYASEMNVNTAAGVARLAYWAGTAATPANAAPYFTQLAYQTVSSGLVGLESVLTTSDYIAPSSPGMVTNGQITSNATYSDPGINSNWTITNAPVLAVYIAPSITWDGQADHTTWNTSAANWNYNSNSASTYANPDFVTFDDTAPANATSISLNTTVSPYLVTVNSNTNNYTISGSGAIAGKANIVKQGTSTLTISTKNSFTGGTTVNAGKLIVGVQNALSTNSPLSINGSAIVQLASNTGLETFSSLAIASNATLDVVNNHILIDYGSGSDPITAIAGYIKSGYNNGHWNGPGIISSAAQTPTDGLLYGLGYADSADNVVSGLTSGQIEVKYTLLGDANLDGVVNGSDFNILAANFNQSVTGWDQGDFNYDGLVNAADFNAMAANFNQSVSGADVSAGDVAAMDAFAAANGLPVDVPEPVGFGLLALGAAALLHRRHRRPRISH